MEYVKVKRLIQVGSNPGQKYLARLFLGSEVTMDQLCTEISESCTVGYPDVLATLKAMDLVMSKHLVRGSVIRMNLLGSFVPSLRAKAQETLDAVDASTIKGARCRFVASKHLKSSLSKTSFTERNLEIKGLQ